MKWTILFVPILFWLKLNAQPPYYDFKNFKEHSPIYKLPENKSPLNTDSLQELIARLEEKSKTHTLGTLLYTQANGTKVYELPDDNMPCLVPDLSNTNYSMPNPVKGKTIAGMPPRSTPRYRVVPKK
jgi:hypothetical protein